jgi:hypothetical protein
LKSSKVTSSNLVKNDNTTCIVQVGPTRQPPQDHIQKHLAFVQFWWAYGYIQTMAINMATPKLAPCHIKHSSFCWQYHFLAFQCESSQWEAGTQNRLFSKEKTSKSNGS